MRRSRSSRTRVRTVRAGIRFPAAIVLALGLGPVLSGADPAARLAAQETEAEGRRGLERHRGFWLSGGLGAGLDEGEGSGAAYFRLGGTLSPRLLLGGELIGLTRDEGDATISRGNVLVTAIFYPEPSGRLFLKGGVGFSSVDVSTEVGEDTTVSVTDEGFGADLGIGFDARLGDNLSLTPGFDVVIQASDDFEDADALLLLTVGLTMH